MVTHVTRQGIRDHTGHMYHTAGLGEFVAGFKKIIEDGRLRSALGVYLMAKEKEKAIARFLELDRVETKVKALENLQNIVSDNRMEGDGGYVDKSAVHFATEEVADTYYGSEKGNEIFFALPWLHIASQYHFSGQLNSNRGGYWNDQWVWANEEKGIDVNVGLTFIPENTPVNSETGSKYELDSEKKPIINQEYVHGMERLISWGGFEKFLEDVRNVSGELRYPETYLTTSNPNTRNLFMAFERQLADDLGIKDKKLLAVIFDYRCISNLGSYKDDSIRIGSEIEGVLRSHGVLYVESKDPISSKKYWENYFSQHEDKRPRRIIYYQGSDPTEAFVEWRERNGINTRYKKSDDPELGFSGSRVGRESTEALAGRDRFTVLATKVIEDFYSQKEQEKQV